MITPDLKLKVISREEYNHKLREIEENTMVLTALTNEELIAYVGQFESTEMEKILSERLAHEIDERELQHSEIDRLNDEIENLEDQLRRD